MGLIVRLFFIMIISSVVLSAVLGWFAVARARLHLTKAFGLRDRQQPPEQSGTVIEGEYRVLDEKEK